MVCLDNKNKRTTKFVFPSALTVRLPKLHLIHTPYPQSPHLLHFPATNHLITILCPIIINLLLVSSCTHISLVISLFRTHNNTNRTLRHCLVLPLPLPPSSLQHLNYHQLVTGHSLIITGRGIIIIVAAATR